MLVFKQLFTFFEVHCSIVIVIMFMVQATEAMIVNYDHNMFIKGVNVIKLFWRSSSNYRRLRLGLDLGYTNSGIIYAKIISKVRLG